MCRQLYNFTKSIPPASGKPYSSSYRTWSSLPKYPEDWPTDDLTILQKLLEKAFRQFPRVVLSCCLQAFKSSDTALFQSAHWFCSHHLLCDPALQANGMHGDAMEVDQGSASSSSSTSQVSLAKEVLSQLPDTQQWLRQAIVSITKGTPPAHAAAMHACHVGQQEGLGKCCPQHPQTHKARHTTPKNETAWHGFAKRPQL